MFGCQFIKSICKEFGIKCDLIGSLIDTSKDENDKRYIYEINNNYFLKITNSIAINEKKIIEIVNLLNNYKTIGVYCPSVIKRNVNKYTYSFNINDEEYTCYMEEKAAYKVCPDSTNINYNLKKQAIEHLGILASQFTGVNLSDRNSMWSIIALSPYDVEIDEKQENFNSLTESLDIFGLEKLSGKLIHMNETSRLNIEKVLDRLPKCVFQGDLNSSNLLIDNCGNFVGLIDYNMFGTEVNINCFLNEAMYYITQDDFDTLTGFEIFQKVKDIQKDLLEVIFKNYSLNIDELEVIQDYNKVIFSSFYPNTALLISLLKRKKHIVKIKEFLSLVCSEDCFAF